MQLWFLLSFLGASPGLPIDSSSSSASHFVRPKQQTPSEKSFIIQQERVAIWITDSPRHENPPVTTNNRWEDDLYNGFLERRQTQSNAWLGPIHTTDTVDFPYKLKCLINKYGVWLISLPPKIWRPKFTSTYKTSDYANDIGDSVFDYAIFGNCIFLPYLSWEDVKRNVLIEFINDSDTA